ncbi:hypothetical protein S245_019248 [Arachis hypogaea]
MVEGGVHLSFKGLDWIEFPLHEWCNGFGTEIRVLDAIAEIRDLLGLGFCITFKVEAKVEVEVLVQAAEEVVNWIGGFSGDRAGGRAGAGLVNQIDIPVYR